MPRLGKVIRYKRIQRVSRECRENVERVRVKIAGDWRERDNTRVNGLQMDMQNTNGYRKERRSMGG